MHSATATCRSSARCGLPKTRAVNYLTWLLRAKRWAARPPSTQRVLMVLGIVVVCLVLFAIERTVGWPDSLTADRMRVPRVY